eukprot:SAG31_NODE_10576_length_1122_cov_0.969697_1_plen_66_part_01
MQDPRLVSGRPQRRKVYTGTTKLVDSIVQDATGADTDSPPASSSVFSHGDSDIASGSAVVLPEGPV